MYKTATLLLTASVVRYLGQLSVFILIARLRGPTDAGTFAFALAVTAPVFILASLGMRTVYLTLRAEIALTHYERLRTVTILAAVLTSVGISFLFPMNITTIVALVACSKALDASIDLYSTALQKASRIRLNVLNCVVVAILQVTTLASALAYGASLAVALGISALSYFLVVVLVVRPITFRALAGDHSKGPPEAVRRPWAEIIRAGFPTGISLGLITGASTIPQYFLGWTSGPIDVGKYATLLYLVVAMEMALNALAQSWIPTGRHLEEAGMLSRARILGIALRWTVITVPLAFVGIAVATFVFPLMFGHTYTITTAEIIPLGVAMALAPVVFAGATSLAIQNRYRWSLVGSTLTVLVGICVASVLIEPWGIAGALWTYVTCLALRAGASLTFAKRELSRPPETALEKRSSNSMELR